MYLVIMDYSWGGLIKIRLSEEQAQRLEEEEFDFIESLKDEYGFDTASSYWMSCETLNEVSFGKPSRREALRSEASRLLMHTSKNRPYPCHIELGDKVVARMYQMTGSGEIGVIIGNEDKDWDDLSCKEQAQIIQYLKEEEGEA